MTRERPVSDWARTQFGDQAADIAGRIVEALTEAQLRAIEAHRASGLVERHVYGGAWLTKFKLFVRDMAGLPGASTHHVPGTSYDLVRINDRLLIPFLLGRTLAEARDKPRRLSSHPLRDTLAGIVPVVAHQLSIPGLDEQLPAESVIAEQPSAPDAIPPVLIGEVCNADHDDLLQLWWGTLERLTPEGDLTWTPEQIPLS